MLLTPYRLCRMIPLQFSANLRYVSSTLENRWRQGF